MFREPERENVFEIDISAAALTDADEIKMGVQKDYGTKDTSGVFSSANPPISVPAPKPISSDMDSRSIFPTKTPSFA